MTEQERQEMMEKALFKIGLAIDNLWIVLSYSPGAGRYGEEQERVFLPTDDIGDAADDFREIEANYQKLCDLIGFVY